MTERVCSDAQRETPVGVRRSRKDGCVAPEQKEERPRVSRTFRPPAQGRNKGAFKREFEWYRGKAVSKHALRRFYFSEAGMNQTTGLEFKLQEMAGRIRELRQIENLTREEMAEKTGVSLQEYIDCEEGRSDLNFAFIYRCALVLRVDVTDIIEGASPRLSSYTVTRRGGGQRIEQAHGMVYYNLAAQFKNRIAEPLPRRRSTGISSSLPTPGRNATSSSRASSRCRWAPTGRFCPRATASITIPPRPTA